MAKRFTRNIKDTTKITDEPLYTNSQNDLISDDTDVAIRHKDKYHYLTDNIKTLSSGDTDRLTITSTGKNSRRITPSENLVLRSEMTDYVDSKLEEIAVTPVGSRVWWLYQTTPYYAVVNSIGLPDLNYTVTCINDTAKKSVTLENLRVSETYFTFDNTGLVSGDVYKLTIKVTSDKGETTKEVAYFTAV